LNSSVHDLSNEHDISLEDGISLDDADVGTTQMENTRSPIQNDDVSNASIDPKQERFTLLLYLINKDVFLDEGDTVTGIVQAAKDLKIDIVLVHEQDSQEGGCEFSQFFEYTYKSTFVAIFFKWQCISLLLT
jgi:hypothetical protein